MVDQLHGFDPEARYNAGTQADDCNLEIKKNIGRKGKRGRGGKRERNVIFKDTPAVISNDLLPPT